MFTIDRNVLQMALDSWGEREQLRQLQEECAELVVAVSKVFRNGDYTENFHEEMADVIIMIHQLLESDGVDNSKIQRYIDQKLERVSTKLKKIV